MIFRALSTITDMKGSDCLKTKIRFKYKEQTIEREITYIPIRYYLALVIALVEILAIIGVVVALCFHSPVFYFIAVIMQIACVLTIIASDDNPDYKVPWLFFVLVIPIIGSTLYFMLYSRTLKRKYIKRLRFLKDNGYKNDDSETIRALESENPIAASQAKMICNIAETSVFTNTKQTYFSSGEGMHESLLADLERAEKFIFLEYYIIDDGVFWGSVLEILKKKVCEGLDVRVVYDDIGCMTTVSGSYFKLLNSYGIKTAVFSFLRGGAVREMNNRSHRKIAVIDGKIGYTGGINIADEYINLKPDVFGHYKDVAVRLEGTAVWELTKLFTVDYGINVKNVPDYPDALYPANDMTESGYVVPFGDGPRPIYKYRVGKCVIQNLINNATQYVYITTPYLVMDNELCQTIENAALRGVDVRVVLPRKNDSRIVAGMGKSYCKRLMDAGVRIYEYAPGFIHAKTYVADGEYAVIGTMNLDYRSLVHNFENGVWFYKCDVIKSLCADVNETLSESVELNPEMLKVGFLRRFWRSVVRIFAPML